MPDNDKVINKLIHLLVTFFTWAHLGSNQGPTDYESVALTD